MFVRHKLYIDDSESTYQKPKSQVPACADGEFVQFGENGREKTKM